MFESMFLLFVSMFKECSHGLFIFSGFNVVHKRRKTGKVGFQHRLGKEDAMKWFQQKYDGIILNSKAK